MKRFLVKCFKEKLEYLRFAQFQSPQQRIFTSAATFEAGIRHGLTDKYSDTDGEYLLSRSDVADPSMTTAMVAVALAQWLSTIISKQPMYLSDRAPP